MTADEITELFNAHRESLIRYLRHQDAEDVVQETWCKVWQHRDKYDPSRPFWPWLRRIAYRLLVNRVRRERSVCLAIEPEDRKMPDMADIEQANLFLSLLDAREREAIDLVHFQGLKFREAAKRLGIPVGSFKTRIHRALELIRRAA